MQKRLIQTLNWEETGQLLDPLDPGQHIRIRIQADIAHGCQCNIDEDTDISDGRSADGEPVILAKVIIQDFEGVVSADLAFFEEDVEFVLGPLLIISKAVVGAIVRENGAVREDAVLDPAIGEGELLNA